MAAVLQPWSKEALRRGTIRPLPRVTIFRKYKGEWYPTVVNDVVDVRYDRDRQLGAATLTFSVPNVDNLYTPENRFSPHNQLEVLDDTTVSYGTPYTPDPQFLSGGDHDKTIYDDQLGGIRLERLEYRLPDPKPPNIPPKGYLPEQEIIFEPPKGGQYPPSGTWTSPVIDMLAIDNKFAKTVAIHATTNTPSTFSQHGWVFSSSIELRARSGNTSDTSNWLPFWVYLARYSNQNPYFNNKFSRTDPFIQVQATLNSGHPAITPLLISITIEYLINSKIRVYIPLLYYGNEVQYEEGIVDEQTGQIQWIKQFRGVIDRVSTDTRHEEVMVRVDCRDRMKYLMQDIIDRVYEPNKFFETLELVYVPPEQSTPDIYVAPGETYRVFKVPDAQRNNPTITNPSGDPKYKPWAQHPPPIVEVAKTTVSGQLVWEVVSESNYQIDYVQGVVYFNEEQKMKDSNNPARVRVHFAWYDLDSWRVEDAIADVIKRALEAAGYKENWQVEADYSINSKSLVVTHRSEHFKIVLDMSQPRITIPYTAFSVKDKMTYFDALSKFKEMLQPNYLIYVDGEGTFIGKYYVQKDVPDYDLELVEGLEQSISDEGIYTVVHATGVRRNTTAVPVPARVYWVNFNAWEVPSQNVNPIGGDTSWFYNNGTTDGRAEYWVDGNIKTQAGWWSKTAATDSFYLSGARYYFPIDAFVIELVRPVHLRRIDVLFGTRPDRGGDNGPLDDNFSARIFATTDWPAGKRVYELGWFRLGDISGGENTWATIGPEQLEDALGRTKVRYIKVAVLKKAPYKANWLEHHACWAISEIRVYGQDDDNDLFDITATATLDDLVERGLISREQADEIFARVGKKTYVLERDITANTEEAVKERAISWLYDLARNLLTATVDVIYAPYVDVGDTVRVINPLTGMSKLYFVERVSRISSGPDPRVTLWLVAWK